MQPRQTERRSRRSLHTRGLLLLLQDITSKREEAERRSRLDRLESLGLLARGFAHEFNNLLTVLLGNLSLAEMRLRTVIQLPEIHTAKQATLQAQGLVQQLLTFARGGAPIKRPTQPGELIEQFFQHHSRAPRIEYRLEISPKLPTLALDPELMLLDEPTQGMGHEDVSRVVELIRRVAANRTVLMVEHNMNVVADLSDTITVLARGSVLAEGPYAQVSKDPRVLEAYVGTVEA